MEKNLILLLGKNYENIFNECKNTKNKLLWIFRK